ncbi:MAG: hypothetical protein HY420_02040 [Candidatus Kerfeldbacteria bacterium]|nr:hypothetical protein [Candidatus Kerfeldbacteria bacterium]
MKKQMLLLFAMFMLASVASATAGKLSIQGHLANGGGPMDGDHPTVFTFYNAPTGGNVLWTETDTIHVQSFLFSATLGQNTPIPDTVFTSSGAWLETTVDGTTLSPRIAYYPQPQLTVTGTDNLWSTDGTDVWRTSGKVGVGTSASGATLSVLTNGENPYNRAINSQADYGTGVTGSYTANYLQALYGTGSTGNVTGLHVNVQNLGSGGANAATFTGGNVGIGTTMPTNRLQVRGSVSLTDPDDVFQSSNGVVRMGEAVGVQSRGKGIGVKSSDGTQDLAFLGYEGQGYFSREVGIGTAPTSAHKLDVAGSIRSSTGGFVFPDGSTQATAAGASLWAANGNDAYNTNVGNVFIGGTSTGDPSAKLQIIAPNPQILIREPNAGVSQSMEVNSLGFSINYDGGSGIFLSRTTGNVGIGSFFPGANKLYVNGNFTATGTKCRLVHDDKFGDLYYNAVESGEAIFSTSGRSRLNKGRCHVELDRKWLAGVTIDEQYPLEVASVVFYGPHGNWYAVPGQLGFIIIDPSGSNTEFYWTVHARQKGYEDVYLNQPEPTTAKASREPERISATGPR